MRKWGMFLIIFALLVCGAVIGWSKVTINGGGYFPEFYWTGRHSDANTLYTVSHLCENPDGRLGRCTSRVKCYHQMQCDRNASIWECPLGHGYPPYVCCIFRKNQVIFPDDGEQAVPSHNDSLKAQSTSTTAPPTNVVSPVELRTILEPATSRGILFPDENGNFKMPSNRIVGMSENATQRALLLKNKERLLPKPSVCGPISLGDKIHGGVEAELGEFPWLVNLEYRTGKCVHIKRIREKKEK